METVNVLKEISTRGRVAFGIACFEASLDFFKADKGKWSFIIEELWSFCYKNMAICVERMIEILPGSVMDKTEFKIKGYEYFTEKEHNEWQSLYEYTNPDILEIIELIHLITRTNLYVEITRERLKIATIPYLEDIISIMNNHHIPLPNIELFKQFPITENNGWGREFTREEVFGSK